MKKLSEKVHFWGVRVCFVWKYELRALWFGQVFIKLQISHFLFVQGQKSLRFKIYIFLVDLAARVSLGPVFLQPSYSDL